VVLAVTLVATSAVGMPANPAAAYDNDTHYYLVYYLARKMGYSSIQSRRIALADVSVDYDPHTEPVQDYGVSNAAQQPRVAFHAFLDERKFSLADPDQLVEALAARQKQADVLWAYGLQTGNPGEFLHFLGDEFAHRDPTTLKPYGSETGHLAEGHTPDYLSNDPDSAWEMVQATVVALQQFAASKPEFGVKPSNLDTTKQGPLFAVFQEVLKANPASLASYALAPDAEKVKAILDKDLGDLGPIPPYDPSQAYTFDAGGCPSRGNTSEGWRLPSVTTPPTSLFPSCNKASGTSWGDTHLGTFDRGHYDFQQVGEYVLARSDLDDFEIQVRQEPWRSSCRVSVNTAVAFHVGDHRVGVYLTDPGAQTVIDDQPADASGSPIDFAGGGSLRMNAAARQDTLTWPNGSIVVVNYGRGSYINLNISLAESEYGHISGLLGNDDGDPANDLTTRDGQVLNGPLATDQLYGAFSDSWRVDQSESLLSYADGQDTTTFTNPDFPCSPVRVSTLPKADADAATAACVAAGVVDEDVDKPFLDGCVLDVAATGDQDFASGAAIVQAVDDTTASASTPTAPATAAPTPTSVPSAVLAATPGPTPTAVTTAVPVGGVTKPVLATAGPWKFVSGGLNAAFPFSEKDTAGFPTAPTIFSASDGLNFASGVVLHVRFVSGGVAQGGGYRPVDANGNKGYACSDPRPLPYGHCPSAYTSGPHFVSELIGVFTDASGTIVGKPFVIGDSADLTVPAGATALSMGVNDSGYFNNKGSMQIAVS
jgi:hypothetical protein